MERTRNPPHEKTIATRYVIALPCEPFTGHKVQGKPYFGNICTVLTTVYATFEDVRTFPNAFLSVVKVGVR